MAVQTDFQTVSQKPSTIMKDKINPNIIIDIATSVISDKPPKTIAGRILRGIKRLNRLRNGVDIKIKKPAN